MVFNFVIAGLVIALVWLMVLTFLLLKSISHYTNLVRGSNNQNLKIILEGLLKGLDVARKDINVLISRCDKIDKESLLHIQKIGLLRFNPFKDTGGDQSFILALLDNNDTGVVISSLYSRSGMRWYAKKIIGGKATEHELSDEEKKAIKEAK